MADGYSALLNIAADIMMRMEGAGCKAYSTPGIVLIDEVEAHLHVSMQKKALPILTDIFPNIQFIVTTHSPFVISSLENAVVYDLQSRKRIEDPSAYSYDAIIEYYYDSDKYSEKIKGDFDEYRTLIGQKARTDADNDRLAELIPYLGNIPSAAAPELVSAFRSLETKRKEAVHG
jgi:hypothetical protein